MFSRLIKFTLKKEDICYLFRCVRYLHLFILLKIYSEATTDMLKLYNFLDNAPDDTCLTQQPIAIALSVLWNSKVQE